MNLLRRKTITIGMVLALFAVIFVGVPVNVSAEVVNTVEIAKTMDPMSLWGHSAQPEYKLAIDSLGIMHFIFNTNIYNLKYTRSTDNGQTWSDPIVISTWAWVFRGTIKVDSNDTL
jgi:hypothetical protein